MLSRGAFADSGLVCKERACCCLVEEGAEGATVQAVLNDYTHIIEFL